MLTVDFEDLLNQFGKNEKKVRCCKIKSILASKACRKSWMIGDPLSFKDMRVIVDNMAELDAPWNCPHGRPTMRLIFRGGNNNS